jgi:hypothetical protein
MRNLFALDNFRLAVLQEDDPSREGAFLIPCNGVSLRVIAASGLGWDHVSVSLPDRTPTWAEMHFVKRAFFEDHETAMQLHPPESDYVNQHPHCLHLWRPRSKLKAIPLPPKAMV